MEGYAGAKTPEVSDVAEEETYPIMTMNMNGKSQGKGTADKRRKLITSTIYRSSASVIFCQELPGFFETKVVPKCGNSYKFVRPEDCYSGKAKVAVMWRNTDFQGKEVNPTDSSLFTEIVKTLIKEEKLDFGVIMASVRSAMVKLTSRKTEASFLAVSWHGPWKNKTASQTKLEVFCDFVRLLRVVCEKEELSSFIIGGDFNFNTSEVDRLAEYGVKRPPCDSAFVPDKDTFIFSIPSDKLPMTVEITVSSVAPRKLENEGGESGLLDHLPVTGDLKVVCTHKKPSIKQNKGVQRKLEFKSDRGSFDSLQHAPLQTGDIPEEDIKRKLQEEFLQTEPRNPELKEVFPRRRRNKNGELDLRCKENRPSGQRNKDGRPDMRFASNKEKYGNKSSVASFQTRNPAPRLSYTFGPVKKDGTPDMRYAVNKLSLPPLLLTTVSGRLCSQNSGEKHAVVHKY